MALVRHQVVKDVLLHDVPKFEVDATVEHARHVIEHRRDWESVTYIFLVGKKGELRGVCSIKELLSAPLHALLRTICTMDPQTVGLHASQERAAILAIHHGIKAIPVVDRKGKLIGVFGTDAILNILQHSGIDDAIRYAGIHVEHRGLLDMLHGRVSALLARRLPWLLVGLAGGFASALLVQQYEGLLREAIELSFFTPAVVYMGAAVAAQTQALFLRSITIGEVRIEKFLARELLVDIFLGLIIGTLSFLITSTLFPGSLVGLIVGLGMFATVSISGLVAVGITSMLAKHKNDPALGSGPFTTIVQDLVSIFVYLVVAGVVLSFQ